MKDRVVLEKVAKQCGASVATNDGPEARQIEPSWKHATVQETVVNDVCLSR